MHELIWTLGELSRGRPGVQACGPGHLLVRCSRTCFLGGFILRIRAKGYDQGKGKKEQDRGTDLGGRGGREEGSRRQRKGMTKHKREPLSSAGYQERPHSEERCSKGLLVP